ncbi:MAG: hypothetical protein HC906_00790 [Bacteroidales bacterium]|nr:hypothetical protein [Bacteroidales bacterium]
MGDIVAENKKLIHEKPEQKNSSYLLLVSAILICSFLWSKRSVGISIDTSVPQLAFAFEKSAELLQKKNINLIAKKRQLRCCCF